MASPSDLRTEDAVVCKRMDKAWLRHGSDNWLSIYNWHIIKVETYQTEHVGPRCEQNMNTLSTTDQIYNQG